MQFQAMSPVYLFEVPILRAVQTRADHRFIDPPTYKSAILTAIFLSNSRVDRASIDLRAVREWPSFCGSTTHRILGSRRCLERLHHEPELLDWTRHRSTKPEDRTPRSGCETLLTVVERSSIENNEGGLETLKCVDGTIK